MDVPHRPVSSTAVTELARRHRLTREWLGELYEGPELARRLAAQVIRGGHLVAAQREKSHIAIGAREQDASAGQRRDVLFGEVFLCDGEGAPTRAARGKIDGTHGFPLPREPSRNIGIEKKGSDRRNSPYACTTSSRMECAP